MALFAYFFFNARKYIAPPATPAMHNMAIAMGTLELLPEFGTAVGVVAAAIVGVAVFVPGPGVGTIVGFGVGDIQGAVVGVMSDGTYMLITVTGGFEVPGGWEALVFNNKA